MIEEIMGFQEPAGNESKKDVFPDVKEVMREHSVFIVHGIHASFTPGSNSLLAKHVDWQTKLNIAVALGPTLSTSTVQSGDVVQKRRLWARSGLVLNGGRVIAAKSGDGATQALSLKERSIAEEMSNFDIAQVLGEERYGIGYVGKGLGYNELVVDSPQYAGLYSCIDDPGPTDHRDLPSDSEFFKAANDLDLPIYILLAGNLYKLKDLDSHVLLELKSVVKDQGEQAAIQFIKAHEGARLTSNDVQSSIWGITESQRQVITGKILNEHVFDLNRLSDRVPEINQVIASGQGQATYMELVVNRDPEHYLSKSTEAEIKGQKVPVLANLRIGNNTRQYFVKNGEFYCREVYESGESTSLVSSSSILRHGYINLAKWSLQLGSSIHDSRDYLLQAGKQLLAFKRNGKTDISEWLAFHIYGFGDQAGVLGDTNTRELAYRIAAKGVAIEQYREVLAKRRKDNSGFNLTLEDIT